LQGDFFKRLKRGFQVKSFRNVGTRPLFVNFLKVALVKLQGDFFVTAQILFLKILLTN